MSAKNAGGNTTVMRSNQHTDIEQLWYTWSELGIDAIEAGFRIRAASLNLHNPRSEQVQFLDQYERYSLPSGTESMIVPPIQAPVCLSLIRPEGMSKAVLVHKAYTGKDGFGRTGAFFVHLLDGLPPDFSAHEAIKLWASDFWQTSDENLRKEDPSSTLLSQVSLEQLKASSPGFDPQKLKNARHLVQAYLPFLTQAFLEKHPPLHNDQQRSGCLGRIFRTLTFGRLSRKEQNQSTPRESIYIAAPDDDVALLIYALTTCLPGFLRCQLTFSTYERNINAAPTEIVGTCWLGHTIGEIKDDLLTHEIIPSGFEQKKLVLNCYDQTCSPLDQHPLIFQRPLAKKYAEDVTKCFILLLSEEYQNFVNSSEEVKERIAQERPEFALLMAFADLFEAADIEEPLDVDAFLKLYKDTIFTPEIPSDETLDALIKNPSLKQVTRKLSRSTYQRALVERIMRDRNWWLQCAQPAILRWQQQSFQQPRLLQALVHTKRQGIRSLVAHINRELSFGRAQPPAVLTSGQEHIASAVDLLYYLRTDESTWLELLDALGTARGAYTILKRNPPIYRYLLERWTTNLSLDESNLEKIKLLLPFQLSDFDSFLNMLFFSYVHPHWQGVIVKHTLETVSPHEQLLDMLAEHYHEHLKTLFKKLVNNQGWLVARVTFNHLATSAYKRKLDLLFILLDLNIVPPAHNGSLIDELVRSVSFTQEELAQFLLNAGPVYLPANNKLRKTMMTVLEELADNDLQQAPQDRKKTVVLRDWLQKLDDWFNEPKKGAGAKRLQTLLEAAKLTPQEIDWFLTSYGRKYFIDSYPTPSILKRLLFERADYWKRYLWTFDINHWQIDEASLTQVEQFLGFLSEAQSLEEEDQQLFYYWHTLAHLIRDPQFLREEPSQVIDSIKYLLNGPHLAPLTHHRIIEKLAIACLAGDNALPSLIKQLAPAISPLDNLALLYTIADCAGAGIREQHYERTMFEICIQYTREFENIFYNSNAMLHFMQIFLDTLLEYAEEDKSTKSWLISRSSHWFKGRKDLRTYLLAQPRTSAHIPPRLWWGRRKKRRYSTPDKRHRLGMLHTFIPYMTRTKQKETSQARLAIPLQSQQQKRLVVAPLRMVLLLKGSLQRRLRRFHIILKRDTTKRQ